MNNKGYDSHPYFAQRAALATMHGKETALAPAFSHYLNVRLQIPSGINTDLLGTFSGEIPRRGTPLETAREKARQGMRALNLPYGLASEGSFGPHRWVPFVAEHHELLIWIDDRLGFEIVEQRVSTETNYGSVVAREVGELDSFLEKILFPSHALIVRPNVPKANQQRVWKGLRNRSALEQAIRNAADLSEDGAALVETDMRAHMNPTRMKMIRQLGETLASRLRRLCPNCGTPGWGVVERLPGLPCSDCGAETDLTAVEIEGCQRCHYRERLGRRDGLLTAPPSRCPQCNP